MGTSIKVSRRADIGGKWQIDDLTVYDEPWLDIFSMVVDAETVAMSQPLSGVGSIDWGGENFDRWVGGLMLERK
jgi:hypothetical protein